MKIAVLGGLGLQGKAVLYDLLHNRNANAFLDSDVEEVLCLDARAISADDPEPYLHHPKITSKACDAGDITSLAQAVKGADAVIDLLPLNLMPNAFEAALASRVSLVTTNYVYSMTGLNEKAKDAGITIMPECGLDPGIDLVICGHFAGQFDKLTTLDSFCGGIPDQSACDNPLNYKISWNFDMLLNSQQRPSYFLKDGEKLTISAEHQHDREFMKNVDYPGMGVLEAVPNGNALFYVEMLGVNETVRNSGRYSLRWPGWCDFWRPLNKLGFLSAEHLDFPEGKISPRRFLSKLLGPQLQYGENEIDLALMLNRFSGIKNGAAKTIDVFLTIKRDQNTGFTAMSQGVGYTASIAAQMIASKTIDKTGLLTPVKDIPYDLFMNALLKRGIHPEILEMENPIPE